MPESFLQRLNAVLESFDNDERERESDLEFYREHDKQTAAKKLDDKRRQESAASQRDELRDEQRFKRRGR